MFFRRRPKPSSRSATWTPVDKLFEVRLQMVELEDRVTPSLTVTNNSDSGPGSLRQIIQAANSSPGTDTITFSIGSGAQTITPASILPTITESVILDATTQPGYSGVPLIEIRGDSMSTVADILSLGAGSSTIKGLVINRGKAAGITIGGTSNANTITGNYIGLNSAGNAAAANAVNGINIFGLPNNTISGNVISGNGGSGIFIQNAGSTGNKVQGNFIGTNAAGSGAVGNTSAGVYLYANSSGTIVGTDGDGVNDANEGNIISGNGTGVFIIANSDNNVVAGNFIGTNLAGTAALANGEGVRIFEDASSNSTRIGTNADGISDALERNIISANTAENILSAGIDTVIAGNYIGTNAAGTGKLGSTSYSVVISNGATGNRVGTNADGVNDTAERNIIAGYLQYGVSIGSVGTDKTTIAGNYIGVDVTGSTPLGGQYGVAVSSGATNTTIGGTIAEARNVIGGNSTSGVEILVPRVTVIGNYIGTNAAGTGKLPNDSGIRVGTGGAGAKIGGLTAIPGTGAGNIVSGNTTYGIALYETATVQGNVVGLASDGLTKLDNNIGILGGGANNVTLGGLNSQARNVISGNSIGIYLYVQGNDGWTIDNNYIGTDRTGALDRSNNANYFYSTTHLTFGEAGAGNVVVASSYYSVYGYGSDWTLKGNRFGTSADGNTPYIGYGVSIFSGNNLNFGGTAAGEGNQFAELVSLQIDQGGTFLGNTFGLNAAGTSVLTGSTADLGLYRSSGFNIGDGTAAGRNVFVNDSPGYDNIGLSGQDTFNNVIRGNYFGTNKTGSAPLGKQSYGIGVRNSAANNTIDGNVIATAAAAGITLDGTGNPDNTLALFRGNGTLANDGGYTVGGTIVGTGVTYGTGLAGTQALSFNRAQAGYVYSEHNASYTFSAAAITVQTWANAASVPANGSIYLIAGNGSPDTPNYSMGLIGSAAGTRIYFQHKTATGYAAYQSAVIPGFTTGTFRHLAVVGNGTDLRFYADGVLIDTQAYSAAATYGVNAVGGDPSIRLYIGGGPSAGAKTFDGRLEDVAVGSYPLTAANISRIATLGGNTLGGSWTRNTHITGNIIGLLANGLTPGTILGDGIRITDSEANIIGGAGTANENVIGKVVTGVAISGTFAKANIVAGNAIGVDGTFNTALPNIIGVSISLGASGNTIGDAAGNSINVISGNSGLGIRITDAGTANNTIASNWIGLGSTSKVIANVGDGIFVGGGATGTIIGTAAGRNFIGGNTGNGIRINGTGTNNSVIAGNSIGTSFGGGLARPNFKGIVIDGGASNTLIGGTSASAGNQISGNTQYGVYVSDSGTNGTIIQGNLVGLTADGTLPLGNGATGVYLTNPVAGTIVGGTAAGARNVISGNGGAGIGMTTSPGGPTGSIIQGNYIGTNAVGTGVVPNATYGIRQEGGTGGSIIGGSAIGAGNLISGNTLGGIFIDRTVPSTVSTIQGNYIGTNAAGTGTLGNGGIGIWILGAGGQTVGGGGATLGLLGTDAFAGNLISGNTDGISAPGNNVIRGNRIGSDRTGTTSLTNSGRGIVVTGNNNQVGGSGAGEGNLISGNNSVGVSIQTSFATNNTVQGNFIGTNAAGTAAMGNISYGIYVSAGATNNIIGGSTTAARNVISGNASAGIRVAGSGTTGNQIVGNYIGTDAAGTTAVPNAAYGVYVSAGATGTIIGGLTTTPGTGLGNVISGNANQGVNLDAGADSAVIRGNLIGLAAGGTAKLGNTQNGVNINSANSFVGGTAAGAGNVISGNALSGVAIVGSAASGNTVAGNLIGTNAAGTAGLGNAGEGVVVQDAGNGNIIGVAGAGNVISGSGDYGVNIYRTSGATVQGNFIGTDAAGTAAIPNTADGIIVQSSSLAQPAFGNLIGGLGNARNVISGNSRHGIDLDGAGVTGTAVQNNSIGVNAAGTAKLGNAVHGITILDGSASNLIVQNLISGNGSYGVYLRDSSSNTFTGNFVGTNAAGTAALGNVDSGIGIGSTNPALPATGNIVGGTTVATRNVVSGNTYGVAIYGAYASGNTVLGNYIGTDLTGFVAIGNGDGVLLSVSTHDNTIGGAARNVISGNSGDGVTISDSGTTNNVVSGNYVGLAVDGNSVLGNASVGVFIINGANNNTVGGLTAGSGNVISGNGNTGTGTFGTNTIGNKFYGNLVGTDFTGTKARGNARFGIGIDTSDSNIVGAPGLGRNIVSANGEGGIGIIGSNNKVVNNYVGTTLDGSAALGNTKMGVWITGGANNFVTGGNLISGNKQDGLLIQGADAFGNLVSGNYIGTNAAGLGAIPNDTGIDIDGANGNLIGTNGDGIADGFERNVISGNTGDGVLINGSKNNIVAGNYIGTNYLGTGAIPNAQGVELFYSSGNVIGTNGSNDAFNASERNIISGNLDRGVVDDSGGTVIAGNWIGIDVNGALLGTQQFGVQVGNGSRLGTNADGVADDVERNVISGNKFIGVITAASGAIIAGNYIGTDPTGTLARPNGNGGLQINSTGQNIIIGSNLDTARNLISGNSGPGVIITDATAKNNVLLGNYIGTTANGAGALPNAVGVNIANGAHDNTIGTTEYGRTTFATNGPLGFAFGMRVAANGDIYVAGNGSAVNSLIGGIVRINHVTGVQTVIAPGAQTAGPLNFPSDLAFDSGSDLAVCDSGSGVVRVNSITGAQTLVSDFSNAAQGPLITSANGIVVEASGNYLVTANDTNAIYRVNRVTGFRTVVSSGGLIDSVFGIAMEASGQLLVANLATPGSSSLVRVNPVTGAQTLVAGGFSYLQYIAVAPDGSIYVTDGGNYAADPSKVYRIDPLTGARTLIEIDGNPDKRYFVGIALEPGGTLVVSEGSIYDGDQLNYQRLTPGGARNVISGNTGDGVQISGTGTNANTILGNFIGTDKFGTATLGNGDGIRIASGASNNIIGGTTAGSRNVISGNNNGVTINDANSAGTLIQGNYIGTDIGGTIDLGNNEGIYTEGANTTIGGLTTISGTGAGNVISGNGGGFYDRGNIHVRFAGSSGTTILGNIIGLNANGSAAVDISIAQYGVYLDSTQNVTVGGGIGGSRNIISGHTSVGVGLNNNSGGSTSGNHILGNYIGTNLNGSSAIPNVFGIFLYNGASDNFIGGSTSGEGNLISGNSSVGIEIAGIGADRNYILGNFIGVNAAGTAALPNANGINIYGSATKTTIGGLSTSAMNVISGNLGYGVRIADSGTTGNFVRQNWIGLSSSGLAIGNKANGVEIRNGASGNFVGGAGFGSVNYIGGNTLAGVYVSDPNTDANNIFGNYIGLSPDGTAARPNGRGVWIANGATNTLIGSAPIYGNFISGNTGDGIRISDAATTGTTVVGNFIGLNGTLAGPLSNATGIVIDGASKTIVGGTTAGDGNVISGNAFYGLAIAGSTATNNTVLGNFIGTNLDGTAGIANTGPGVVLQLGAHDNTIGGLISAARNIISGNTGPGVLLQDGGTANNAVSGNFIGVKGDGASRLANASDGIRLDTGAVNTTIRGNVISANGLRGIAFVNVGTDGNTVRGNYIGLGADGQTAVGNGDGGIYIRGAGNQIGGPASTDRNIIGSNQSYGVVVEGANNTIRNNYIGTDITGVLARGNNGGPNSSGFGYSGFYTSGANTIVADNVIAATQGPGVWVRYAVSAGSVFTGNRIGTNAAGTGGLGNSTGVLLTDGVTGVTFGQAGAGNLVSGNTNSGIILQTNSSGNVFAGNIIGSTAAGNIALSNGVGITISSSSNNTFGGPTLSARNVIAGNATNAVYITGSTTAGNKLQGNSIGTATLANGGVGILVDGGAKNNIIGGALGVIDPAYGNLITNNTSGVIIAPSAGVGNLVRLNTLYGNAPANLVNTLNTPTVPTMDLAVANAGGTRVRGTISGAPNGSVTVDFYETIAGELSGRRYLGTAILTLGSTGTATYDLTIAGTTNPGAAVTTTVSVNGGGTSGFSNPQTALAPISISVFGPQVAPEGTEVTFTSRVASDRLNAIFSFDWRVTKDAAPGLFAFGSDASLNFTPTDNGTYHVMLTVTDNVNNEAISFVAPDLIVTNVTPLPTVMLRTTGAILTSTTLALGATLPLRATATDPGPADVPTLAYQWFVNGSPVATGTSYDFTPTVSGDYIVSLSVTDKDGAVGTRAVAVSARGSITASIDVRPTASTEGAPVTANVRVTSATDTSRLQYAWRVTKNGVQYQIAASTASQQVSQITFTPDDDGTYRVSLTVTDPTNGATATASSDVTVNNVAPAVAVKRLTAVPALGAAVAFTAVATDPGTTATHDDLLQHRWQVRGPKGFTPPASAFGVNFAYTPTVVGAYFVTVTTTDKDGGTGSDTHVLEVTGGSLPAVVSGLPTGPIVEGAVIPLTASVPGAATTFTYAWTVTRNGNTFAMGSGAAYSFKPGRIGNYNVSVTATGANGTVALGSVDASVTNAPPTAVIAPSPATAPEGTALTFTSQSRDAGGSEESLTLAWTVSGPGIPAVPPVIGRKFDWIVANDATYTVTLTATDPSGASAVATRTVLGANVAPVVKVVNNGTAGSSISVRADVAEPGPIDQTVLTYQWSVNGAAVSGATSPAFITTASKTGPTVVSVAVNDKSITTNATADVRVLTTAGSVSITAPAVGATEVLVIGTAGDNDIDASTLTVGTVIDGGAGNDIIRGGSGDDVLFAGVGTNKLYGGNGNNRYIGGGDDSMFDGPGNGTFVVHFSNVTLDAGSGGLDTIDLSTVPFGIKLDLTDNTGFPQPVNALNTSKLALIGSFENLLGTIQADDLVAAAGSTVSGGGGGDKLTARGPGATLIGGKDSGDSLTAEPGASGSILKGGDAESTYLVEAADVSLIGGKADDIITLTPEAIRSLVQAGEGPDTINATVDASTLIGGKGDDRLYVTGRNNLILSGDATIDANGPTSIADSGNDTVVIDGDTSSLIGGDGNDKISVKGFGDSIRGGDGKDTIVGTNGGLLMLDGGFDNDNIVIRGDDTSTLIGGDGNDKLTAGGGLNPLIIGGDGIDTLIANDATGNVTLIGGKGNDTILVNPSGGATVPDGSGGETTIPATRGAGILVDAGDDADYIRIDAGDTSSLIGGKGDDIIVDRGGKSLVIYGGDDVDLLIADSPDGGTSLIGGANDDKLIANPSTPQTIATAHGDEYLVPASADDLSLIGGSGNDKLTVGGGNRELLVGNDGNDELNISGGDTSSLIGGSGNDTYKITGTATRTIAVGGDDQNSYEVSGGDSSTLIGGKGEETYTVSGGTNTIAAGNEGVDLFEVSGGSNTTLLGGAGDDNAIVRGGKNVRIDGNAGKNTAVVVNGESILIVGGDDVDTLAVTGGTGVVLIGGASDDKFIANGSGTNVVLSGGDGNDTFAINPTIDTTLLGGTRDEISLKTGANGPVSHVIVLGDAGNDIEIANSSDTSTLVGGSGGDTLIVKGSRGVVVSAGDDSDTIALLDTTDTSTLIGGSGNDKIIVKGAPNAVVSGGAGQDAITVIGAGGIVYGDEEIDTLNAGSTIDTTLLGGTANETIIPAGPATNAILVGGAADDVLTAVSGDRNMLVGNDGNDTFINIAADHTTLYGLAGDDKFDLRGGSDVTALGDLSIYGYTGIDTFTVSGGTRVAAYGEDGNDIMTVTNGNGVSLYGGAGNDDIRTTGGTSVLLAGNSDSDVLRGNGVNSAQLYGGLGNDILYTGGLAGDVLVGEEGDDRYQLTQPSATGTSVTLSLDEVRKLGDDEPYRDSYGFGTDILDFRTFSVGVNIDLSKVAGKTATANDVQSIAPGIGLVLFGVFDSVYGTNFADTITGNDADNLIYGFDGNDILAGGAGNDTLAGGAGTNSLNGGIGSDVFQFTVATPATAGTDTITDAATDAGTDVLDFSPLTPGAGQDQIASGVNVNLGLGSTQTISPDRSYTIAGGVGLEGAIGTRFNDTLLGTAANDSLVGGDGNDSLTGGLGNDSLAGGTGTNLLFGGGGDDWYSLTPGGTDRLTETSGIDTLDFINADRGVTVSLAPDAGQLQTVDSAGNVLALTGTFERLLGSSFDDNLTGNAADNDIIGRGGLDTLFGGTPTVAGGTSGNDYLQGGFTQVVFLDFDSDTRPGEYVYSSAQRVAIQTSLESLYGAFGFQFTADALAAATMSVRLGSNAFTTLRFNSGAAGGQSDQIDPRNGNPSGLTQIDAYDFIVRYLPASNTPATIDAAMTSVSANIAAHELGHQVGLRHADAFGPIGSGIYGTGSLTPADFPGTYIVGTNGTETPEHVMASPLSLGTSNDALLGSPYFSEREALKLMFGQYGSATGEPVAAHRTVATAAALSLQPLLVPNTLHATDGNFGLAGVPNTFAVSAAAVSGRIDIDPATGLAENDYYAFSGRKDQIFTFELASVTAKRFRGGQIDGILKLYDAAGNLLAMNDDDFESQDSLLLDVKLTADGIYYIVVDTFSGVDPRTGITTPDTDTGRYELLTYTLATGTPNGRGDSLIGGDGRDTLVGGVGKDIITIPSNGGMNTVDTKTKYTIVDETKNPSYDPTKVTGPGTQVGINHAPTFTVAPTTAATVEGSTLSLQYAAVDTDGGSNLRYELVGAPTGAGIDPATGKVFWVPADNGSYTFSVRAVDPVGSAAVSSVTITVTNAAPVVNITGLPAISAPEGASIGFGLVVVDPSAIDQAAGFTYAWTLTSGTTTVASGTSATIAYTPPNDGTYQVKIKVTDKDGAATTVTQNLVIANVAPTVTLVPSLAAVPQGSPVTFTATTTDPSATDVANGFTYTWKVNGTTVLTGKSKTTYTYTPRVAGTDSVTVSVADNKDTTTTTLNLPVLNVAPTIAGLTVSTATRVEGSPVTATVTFTDPGSTASGGTETYTIRWTATGSSGQTLTGTLPAAANTPVSFNFVPDDNGSYNLRAEVVENTPAAASTDIVLTGITVNNAAPTAGISGPGIALMGDNVPFVLTANDPSAADRAAGFTFRIDWNGDGVVDQTVTGPSGTTVTHTFPDAGTKTVRVTAVDKDGGISPSSSLTISVAPVSLVGGMLTVFGTTGDDEIHITRTCDGRLQVQRNCDVYGPYAGVTKIVVYGNSGDDEIVICGDVSIPAALYGEAGNDSLRGGSGGDTLDGGTGNDELTAIAGNDLLLGGDGDDTLRAGSGADSLFGGSGNDSLVGGTGTDAINGDDGNDTLRAGTGNDTLHGGAGDDVLLAGSGNDNLFGDAGNDSLRGGSGADILDGGLGYYDTIIGGSGDDVITDGDGAVSVSGGSGNDSISINFGTPPSGTVTPATIDGGDGSDTITITSTNANLRLSVVGGGGDDLFNLSGVWLAIDVTGGSGFDRLHNTGTGIVTLHGVELVQ